MTLVLLWLSEFILKHKEQSWAKLSEAEASALREHLQDPWGVSISGVLKSVITVGFQMLPDASSIWFQGKLGQSWNITGAWPHAARMQAQHSTVLAQYIETTCSANNPLLWRYNLGEAEEEGEGLSKAGHKTGRGIVTKDSCQEHLICPFLRWRPAGRTPC